MIAFCQGIKLPEINPIPAPDGGLKLLVYYI